ncbi:transporter substrate-binding domain-containing protein [Cerasicoccus fimbriatus]|uniref:transporter substrate-binding domain-containing protein n=1 Tax=Cerasicoccus fimbriatus TaxID=3014554 RepID=UPI0022B520C3|nr:transporter substrate-binding domain-containing protein [Cerasicoccus sp. TK19100]
MVRRYLSLVFVAVFFCCSPLFGQLAPDRPAPKFLPTGELRVGINPEQPPLIFVHEERIVGLEADLARAFAVDLGVPLNFVVMEWDELIPALVAGKIDIIMSGMSATEIRSVRINFATPYLVTGQMPMVRASDLSRYQTTMALKNTQARIGVEGGTTGDFLVRESFVYAERVPYKDIQDAADGLANGEIDMVIADAPTIWWLAAIDETSGLSPVSAVLTNEMIGWGISKANPDLRNAADSFLVKLQGNGELDPMIERWMPFATKQNRQASPQPKPAPEPADQNLKHMER